MGRRTEERANIAGKGDFFGKFLTMGIGKSWDQKPGDQGTRGPGTKEIRNRKSLAGVMRISQASMETWDADGCFRVGYCTVRVTVPVDTILPDVPVTVMV
jgi:hypothetical protein